MLGKLLIHVLRKGLKNFLTNVFPLKNFIWRSPHFFQKQGMFPCKSLLLFPDAKCNHCPERETDTCCCQNTYLRRRKFIFKYSVYPTYSRKKTSIVLTHTEKWILTIKFLHCKQFYILITLNEIYDNTPILSHVQQ